MEFTAKYISELVHGTVVGNAEVKVNTIAKIEEGIPGTITFLGNPIYEKYIYTTKSSIVIVNNDFTPNRKLEPTLIKVENAYQAFAMLLEIYNKITSNKTGFEEYSFIDSTAKTGERVYVGSFSYVSKNVTIGDDTKIHPQVFLGENVKIGKNVTIFPGVKIYPHCVIGNDCTIHSGVVIGGDGFGFAQNSDNNYKKIPQVGNVVIEDFVEIGSNTTIDRATLGSTIIRKGVKLDNLIQIAHNVEIGENTVIAAQTGISGSTKIGKNCMIGGQVGIVGHIKIADGVKIAAQSGVGASIENDNEQVQGSPSFKATQYQKAYVSFRSLPDLIKQINNLQTEIELLKKKLGE